MHKDVTISRTEFLTRDKMRDCYYVISANNGLLADNFFWDAERDVNKNGHILFTAETPRMVVGLIKGRIITMPDKVMAEIKYFFVSGKFRRSGIGRALLAAYEEHVRANFAADRIMLHSAPAVSTLEFYKRSGFKIVGAQYLMAKDIVH